MLREINFLRTGRFKRKQLFINLSLAFLINIIFLILVCLFCDMKYEVSDDFMMDAILSGAYGNGLDLHLLFSNILYGYLLKLLYQLFPATSWYFVFQIALCFFSLCAVTYIILEKNQRFVGILLAIIFVSFFSDDLYILVQFTKTATAAACAGGALFLSGFWRKEKGRVPCMALGALLALGGSMVRFSSIYLSLAFLSLIFLRYAWKNRKNSGTLLRTIAGIGLCGLLVLCAFGLEKADKALWNGEESYAAYKGYNSRRAAITDMQSYGYNTIAPDLAELSLNETDYNMFSSWNFLDQDQYTPEILSKVAQIKKQYNTSVQHSIKGLLKQFRDRHYETYLVAMGIAVLLLLLLILEPRKLPWQLLELGVAAVLLLYFFYRGRVVYRVEYSIFLCLGISLVTAFEIRTVAPEHKKVFVYWCIMFCLCKTPLYLPDKNYEAMSDEEYARHIFDVFYRSGSYDLRKYRCDVSNRQPYGNLTAYMEADTEYYYLLDFNTTIQLVYYNYKPWERIPEGIWKHYSYLGGVNMGYPDTYRLWEENGIDTENPFKSLVNENIYVVDNINYETKLKYLQEHYYPNARIELVGKIDEMQIWKYYSE